MDEYENYENYLDENSDSPCVVSKTKTKRKKQNETDHSWTDTDVFDLITAWQQEECLFNSRHKDYHNSTKRNIALQKISMEIQIPAKEVNKKMIGLRSYYGQLKQKVNISKKSWAGTEQVFTSQWQFFDEMDCFLSDT